MKKTVFTGVGTALITPFDKNEKVDFEAMGKIIDWQIEEGVDALIICGTTGEKSTLESEEHKRVLEFAVEKIAGRVPCIAGTGSNDTAHGIEMTKHACKIGCDAVLLVTPYYNKATQGGLIKSFYKFADASTKPVILYNVPSRTGVNITPATAEKLAEHENIAGLKEASGDIAQIVEIAQRTQGKLDIYSGNDDHIVPVLSVGGKGVISVLSNVMPKETTDICKLFFEGKIKESYELQFKLLPLIKQLFCEVNPIPVKAAMANMGLCENVLRLPLTQMEEVNEQKLISIMKDLGIALK